ncbi:MAG: 7-carboxy-7-deazaguanine synthase QueE [Cyanobacteria bacterium RUI128]|nr:7-carboxy-7-deazaguanine synthase QueE [Cyanobacteria bacterium RUI128]
MEMNRAKIKEIFSSIQGEGPFIGCKQIFVRFCACNLSCAYCDTDFYPTNINDKNTFFEFTPDELADYLKSNFDINSTHSISLTGGEPLIWADFLKEFMPKLNVRYYLETNATIDDNAKIVLPLTDILAADIKLPSCSGIENAFDLHKKFFDVVKSTRNKNKKYFSVLNNNSFAKVVFDDNITDDEIETTVDFAKKYDFEIILQPRMQEDKPAIGSECMMEIFEKFVKQYKPTRLIPQVHKFINVE